MKQPFGPSAIAPGVLALMGLVLVVWAGGAAAPAVVDPLEVVVVVELENAALSWGQKYHAAAPSPPMMRNVVLSFSAMAYFRFLAARSPESMR
jgi:hypothetical protein